MSAPAHRVPASDDELRAQLARAAGGRYEIHECLGSGGSGVVYRARDREVGAQVAIKVLRSLDAESLYRFKHEFRHIARLAHPNLARLYELTGEGDLWFLTMEYVPGTDFKTAVRGPESHHAPVAGRDDQTAPVADPSTSRVNERLLRSCLDQLVAGLSALHEGGVLHLDVKPSNVRVTPEGRVVLLDFGIAQPRDDARASREIVGTLRYMAPERFETGGALPASDWYAVGCLLFESLVGYLPYSGPIDDDAPPRRHTALPEPTVPAALRDLARLAAALTASQPAERPRPPFSLGGFVAPPAAETSSLAAPGGDVTIGREGQLDALRRALATASGGRGVAVHLSGRSGAGKSTVLRLFSESARAYGAVVLAGKCYERESVPYEALDSIVDALGRFLAELPAHEQAELLPAGLEPLARIFPTLRRVPAIAAAGESADAPSEPDELRRTAFARFRELVTAVATRRPLVLIIDDLQWGDADSLPLLDLLVERPEETPVLLLLAYRSEDRERSALLQALAGRAAGLGGAEVITVEVDALGSSDAIALARLLLRQGGGDPRLAGRVAAESAGLPYFIHELCRHVVSQGRADARVSLDALIRARSEAQDEASRRLLEVACVSGRPTPLPVLIGAAALAADDSLAACSSLVAAHLARWVRADAATRWGQDLLEPYHDRISAEVVRSLPDERRRAHHAALVVQLEKHSPDDVDALVIHCRESGQTTAARAYALRAADLAYRALAFDRAATLYQTAIDLDPGAVTELRLQQAAALDFAGRAAPAARAYLAAMPGVEDRRAAEFERQAALLFFKAGHVDEALATLESVLARAGLRLPRGPALAALVWSRFRLRLRGLGYKPRKESEIDPVELARIDGARVAAIGLGLIDTFRGALFQTEGLRLALGAGEERRLVRALGTEAAYSAADGARGAKRTRAIIDRGRELAARLDDRVATAWFSASEALFAYQSGHFAEAYDSASLAIASLHQTPESSTWEISNVELWRIWALYYLGRCDDLVSLVRERLRIARDRGDRYDLANLHTGPAAAAWLVVDSVDEGRRHATEAMSGWTTSGYHLQHYAQLVALTHCDLYEGKAREARDRVEAAWPRLERSLLMHISSVNVEARHLRGRVRLAAGGDARGVARDLRVIEKVENPWATALAALLRAGLGGIDELRLAEERCREAGMMAYALAAQWRRGLKSGEKGLVDSALAELRKRGVVAPERYAGILVP